MKAMIHKAVVVMRLWKTFRAAESHRSLTAVVAALVPMLQVVMCGKRVKMLEKAEQMAPERR
jgi:hypothetical protein